MAIGHLGTLASCNAYALKVSTEPLKCSIKFHQVHVRSDFVILVFQLIFQLIFHTADSPAHLGGSGLSGPNELPLGSPQLPLTQRSPTPCFLVQTCSNWNRSPPLTVPKILGRSQKNGSFRRFQEFNGHYMVTLWGSWQLPLFFGGKPLLRPRGPWASRCRIMAARVHRCRRAVRTDRLRALWNCVAQWIVELYPKIVTLSLDHGFSTN